MSVGFLNEKFSKKHIKHKILAIKPHNSIFFVLLALFDAKKLRIQKNVHKIVEKVVYKHAFL